MSKYEEFLWECAEELAYEKFYIKSPNISTPDNIAEKPAFLLFRGFFGSKWALTFGPGIEIWRLSSKAKAYAKIQEIISTSVIPVELLLKTSRGYKVIAQKEAPS